MQKVNRFMIHTEDKKPKSVEKLVQEILGSATIHRGNTGVYKGVAENSIVIEHIGNNENAVRFLAQQIKVLNNQESVLVTRTPISAELI